MSNLATRLLTATVAAPILLGLIFVGPPWGWFAFVLLAAAIGALELFGMTHPGDRAAQVVGIALTLGVMGVLWTSGADARALATLLLVLPFFALFFTLARLGDIATATLRVATMTFTPLYLGGGLAAVALLKKDGGADGPGFVLLSLMLSWLSDTGAYFAGRFFGKHKLFPAVSPKKTIEGAIGGLGGAVVGALLAHFVFLRSLPLGHGLGLAIVGGALGQAGDLGESMIKRSVGVKDSGGIVPGHGGILDRADALVVTSIVLYLYLSWARMH
jgi:phosphatidate cytidylyltransferase